MKMLWVGVVLLAGCAPDFASGSYLCGAERSCPDGLACSGDNLCVDPLLVKPFDCRGKDMPGDDTPASAIVLGNLGCEGAVREVDGCLVQGDVGDFVSFDVPAGCTGRVLVAVVSPLAFSAIDLQVGRAGEPPMTVDTTCRGTPNEGNDLSCLEAMVQPGSYVLGAVLGGRDCDGSCAFNRYTMAIQVSR